MRQISLDTETTGFYPDRGDRVIEIGAVEIVDGKITGRHYQQYINPDVDSIHPGAVAVHGLTVERLSGEPYFGDCAEAFLEFVAGAELIIHNARFDVGFLDAEMRRLDSLGGRTLIDYCPKITDTVKLARARHPGLGNKLDDLRLRYGIPDERELHGALIDAKILAKVYLRLTEGEQGSMGWS